MLTRWNPYREMMKMQRMMDRMMDRNFFDWPADWENPELGLALDVVDKGEEFLVKASIPGINPDDLEITYKENVLTIQGELKAEEEKEEEQYYLRERRYGRFSRSIALPTIVDADKIEAKYHDGILTLRLPKAEESKPKRIEIKTGKMLEG